ncbi:hypothetical protein J2X46_003144 [Nocardioides sp. BE266]|nr:hypothetical protein [Nocardioides sp. BE266]
MHHTYANHACVSDLCIAHHGVCRLNVDVLLIACSLVRC